MQKSLEELLDSVDIEGLALDRQPTGWVASISFPPGYGNWSPLEFSTTASGAIRKAIEKHAPASTASSAAGLPPLPVLAPPPY